MTIRMGYWDCPSCGQKRVEGPQPNCTTCGKPRGPTVAFYTDEAAVVVEDPAMVARARAGADWHCRYCNGDNRAGMIECQHCGAGPDGTRRRVEQFVPNAPPPPPPKKSNAAILIGALVALVVLLFGGCWFFFLRTTAHEVTVTAAVWSKSIDVEQLTTERKEAWREDVPSGAREISRTTRSHQKQVQEGTTRVKVGKKNLGNGMFEDVYKDEPKYVTKSVDDTWVTYEVDTWRKQRQIKKETTDGTEPPEPVFTPTRTERIGARNNELLLDLKAGDGKILHYTVDLAKERAPIDVAKGYKVGQRFTAMVNTVGSIRELRK